MNTFTIDANTVRAAQVCQATNDARYYLCGICFMADGRVAGTDGHILAIGMPAGYKERVYFVDSADVPQDTIIKLQSKVPANVSELTFYIEEKYCRTDKGTLIPFEYVDGKYPDINRIIPTLPRASHSTGLAIDSKLIIRLGQAVTKGTELHFYPGTQNDGVLVRTHSDFGDIHFVVMPKRTKQDNQFTSL